MIIGQHLLIECHGQHADLNAEELSSLLRQAAIAGGAHILFQHFHKFGTEGGVTGVLILAESHITVHTWPEYNYAAFDIFMCGNTQPKKAADVIAAHFPDAEVVIKMIDRASPRHTDHEPALPHALHADSLPMDSTINPTTNPTISSTTNSVNEPIKPSSQYDSLN